MSKSVKDLTIEVLEQALKRAERERDDWYCAHRLERERRTALELKVDVPVRPPGRPVSTGSAATKLVRYRVTAAQRAELDEEARRLGLSSADLAAKARAFPKLGTEVKR